MLILMDTVKKSQQEKIMKLKEELKEIAEKMYKFEMMFNELIDKKQEWDPEDLIKDI